MGRNKEKDIMIVVMNVFSTCELKEKWNMWEELRLIRQTEACKT